MFTHLKHPPNNTLPINPSNNTLRIENHICTAMSYIHVSRINNYKNQIRKLSMVTICINLTDSLQLLYISTKTKITNSYPQWKYKEGKSGHLDMFGWRLKSTKTIQSLSQSQAPLPGGNIADHLYLKVHSLGNILSHVFTLDVGALGRNGGYTNVTVSFFEFSLMSSYYIVHLTTYIFIFLHNKTKPLINILQLILEIF